MPCAWLLLNRVLCCVLPLMSDWVNSLSFFWNLCECSGIKWWTWMLLSLVFAVRKRGEIEISGEKIKKHDGNGTRNGYKKNQYTWKKRRWGGKIQNLSYENTVYLPCVGHFCQHSSGEEFSPSHVALALATEFLIHCSIAEINEWIPQW